MKNMMLRAIAALMLTSVTMLSVLSCAEKPAAAAADKVTIAPGETISDETTEERDTRFDGVDFEGRTFRVQTSVDAYDATNANALIEGSGELNGDVVNDAVYNRNLVVSELLNIDYAFTQSSFTYDNAEANIRKLVMSASDDYDLIINDDRALAALTDENTFININNPANFDYDRSYWYTECMEDLQIIPGMMYIMAGDYFMDVIASCHCMFYNKQLCTDYYGDPNYLYGVVLDGSWTYETAAEVSTNAYADLNGDGKPNADDRYGFAVADVWGCVIPLIGSSGINFVDRTTGYPEFCFNNETSVDYLTALNKLYWGDGVYHGITDDSNKANAMRKMFGSGQTLLLEYNRLGDLEKMRDIEAFEIGVIPYPKFNETDGYTTSIHDTTEMGAIPITNTDMDFTTTVIEVLGRETSSSLMPVYYETALKVKYITDETSATMIDLVHDSFGSSFPIVYDNSFNGIMLHSFTNPLGSKSTDFVSAYAKLEKAANKQLEKMIEQIETNND